MAKLSMRKPRLSCLMMIGALVAAPAFAQPVQVEVTAEGISRNAAIVQGLIEAIREVTGVAISADEVTRKAFATGSTTSAAGDTQSSALAETAQAEIRSATNGVVRSYRVVDTEVEDPNHVVLHLSVSVEKFEPKGLGNESRRRIAVAQFDDGGAHGMGSQLRDSLLAYLTQARRFAVVDRANDQVYAQEMALVTGQDAAPTERARAGQVIGADYVVTGKLRVVAPRTTEQFIELAGERVQHTTPGSASADFQVIEIATRQIKWAGTITLPSGGDASLIAARIGEDITQAIYPLRLIKFDDPQALVVNEGGMGVHQGQRLRAMLLGQALVDPYTHESLGQSEQEIGVIEISEVQSKVSYARLVSGRLPAANQEIVLRAAIQNPSPAPHRPRPTAGNTAPSGGVRLPFDR